MRRTAFTAAVITVLGMGIMMAPAVSAATAAPAGGCSASGSGSPGGSQIFTLHMRNSCGFPTRATTLCEPDSWPYPGLHWAYGPWRYGNSTSTANCGGGTQAQLQWGYDTPTQYRELGHAWYYGPLAHVTLTSVQRPAQPAGCVPSTSRNAYNRGFNLVIYNGCGLTLRATVLCEYGPFGGTWNWGPWRRSGTSGEACNSSIFSFFSGVRAWGEDIQSGRSYNYRQLGSNPGAK